MADQENSVVEVNPDEMEFTIPIDGMAYVETELEKLNKRAKRLKLEPMKLVKVGTKQDTISVKYNPNLHGDMERDANGYVKIPVKLITLRIELRSSLAIGSLPAWTGKRAAPSSPKSPVLIRRSSIALSRRAATTATRRPSATTPSSSRTPRPRSTSRWAAPASLTSWGTTTRPVTSSTPCSSSRLSGTG